MKLIQLSTSQCPPCVRYKETILKHIDKIPYEYEYIELYNGVDKTHPDFDIGEYWNQVHANIAKYREVYELNFMSFPTFIVEEGGEFKLIPKREVLSYVGI